LNAEQLNDWARYYACEPWGEERADMRAAAGLAVQAGADGFTMFWPYEDSIDLADVRSQAAALEAEIARIQKRGDSGENQHPTGCADG
jgi:hypothetical protein